jgi:peptidoglycan hydrolase-like protein with peptidoglycan-binding domain
MIALKVALGRSGLFGPGSEAKNDSLGPQTFGNLRWFQLVNSMPVPGNIDQTTRAGLLADHPLTMNRIAISSDLFPKFSAYVKVQGDFESVLSGQKILNRKDSTPADAETTKVLQHLLNRAGVPREKLPETGKFGQQTEAAILEVPGKLASLGRFNGKDGLDAHSLGMLLPYSDAFAFDHGKVNHNPSIVEVLSPVLAGRYNLSVGMQGEDVRAYQMLLKKIIPTQTVNGVFGPETQNNTAAAMVKAGISADNVGPVGGVTLPKLIKLAADSDAHAKTKR